MIPVLKPLIETTHIDYKQQVFTLKMFDQDSIMVEHEHSSLSNSFALRLCGDKYNGTYVEVGSSHWLENNDTYMLEKYFGWTGVGIEIEQYYVNDYTNNRSNPCIHGDATKFNWDKYFEENNFPKQIDHLSIDTDSANLLSLMNMPLSRYRFSTIVVENKISSNQSLDLDGKVKKIQQQILASYDYTLIGSGYTDDFWIDNTYLNYQGQQLDPLQAAFWYGKIPN